MTELDLNVDFRDLLLALADAEADFVLVGGGGAGVRGHVRGTDDLDVLVRATSDTAARVFAALAIDEPQERRAREPAAPPPREPRQRCVEERRYERCEQQPVQARWSWRGVASAAQRIARQLVLDDGLGHRRQRLAGGRRRRAFGIEVGRALLGVGSVTAVHGELRHSTHELTATMSRATDAGQEAGGATSSGRVSRRTTVIDVLER
ncbi:MAG: hypothetical protein JRI23_16405 [Deltaproteobacteria bacterium]|nr:hypothetical protein [Deltaproteobacteria bacterium]MBW2533357.1 hypothetical protein [Deltaproteobacteria bacterium]